MPISPSQTEADRAIALRFSASYSVARQTLRRQMVERGLLEADGWKIADKTRQRNGRSELVLSPVHLRLKAPEELECVVWVDEAGSDVGTDCTE